MAKTNKATSEEIIEKKESNPLGTASLILCSLAMIGAIAFCVAEIMEYRTDLNEAEASDANPARMIVGRDSSAFKRDVAEILGGSPAGLGDDDDDDVEEDLGDDDDDMEEDLGDDDDDMEEGLGDDDDDVEEDLGDDDDDMEEGLGDDDDDVEEDLGDDDDDF